MSIFFVSNGLKKSGLFVKLTTTHHGNTESRQIKPAVPPGVLPDAVVKGEGRHDSDRHQQLDRQDSIDFADEPAPHCLVRESVHVASAGGGAVAAALHVRVVTAHSSTTRHSSQALLRSESAGRSRL